MSDRFTQSLLERAARWLSRHPKSALAGAVFYFIIPIDLIPEILAGPLGFIDDFIVLLLPLIAREYVRRLNRKQEKASGPVMDTTEIKS